MKNNIVTGPVRAIAEALGANVNWNEADNTVEITNKQPITKEQVSNWINSQGKEERYYIYGLSYELVNLDNDSDLEIVAKIDGAVHIGNFFILDKTEDGIYKLIDEKLWKAECPKLNQPIYVNGKKVFETVVRTGGTGADVNVSHLWYLENGKMVEAWQGKLKERLTIHPSGGYLLNVGSYQIICSGSVYESTNDYSSNRLYYWETKYKFADDNITKVGEPVTTSETFKFDGKTYRLLD